MPPSNSKKLSSAALEAHTLIHGVKKDSYGPVEESYVDVATIATIVCKKAITPDDVCKVMLAVKLVREGHRHSRDNLVDFCGYAAMLQQLHDAGKAYDIKEEVAV